jgi:hypothetical protein
VYIHILKNVYTNVKLRDRSRKQSGVD